MDASNRSITLEELVAAAGDVVVRAPSGRAVHVTGLSYDSRRVQPGDLFFCVPGAVADGHRFAAAAVRAGAVALCVERALGAGVPETVVSDARKAMARMSAAFFGRPGDALTLVGVTGTNGKTTTAFLMESIFRAAGETTGLIGTIETRIAGHSRAGVRTTPESVDLQALLADMVATGVSSVAMEVTSHGLALHRVEGLRFSAAAFTNLSQDHLDFHAGMEDYFEAKKSLFVPERVELGAVNVDDPYGRRLLASSDADCIGFGLSADADVRAADVRYGQWGSEFVAVTPAGEMKIATSLSGAFNVYNCLAAVATTLAVGVPPEAVQRGIEEVAAVPGRFESIDEGQPFAVIVDYAHTPDSLDNVLRAARRLAGLREGRVVCVFGCGGDRDPGKRPLMGAVAARGADVVVVTSDNPRSEEPAAIIDQVLEGVMAERPEGPDAALVDRREAIGHALRGARAGDVVVIAGKGHETGQEFADVTLPFDDREVAREELAGGRERRP